MPAEFSIPAPSGRGLGLMPPLITSGLTVAAVAAVLLDLGFFRRRRKSVRLAESLAWSVLWFVLAFAFTGLVFISYEFELVPRGSLPAPNYSGQEAALEFFALFLTEKAVALANLWVIAIIFSRLQIPLSQQWRVLFWTIITLVALRLLALLGAGILIAGASWTRFIFAVLLILSAARVLVARRDTVHPERNVGVHLFHSRFPAVEDLQGESFLVRREDRLCATPLAGALILVLTANAMFAIDSVPAAFAISREPLLIYAGNLFSLLGLRALYFVVFAFIDRLRYLQLSLVTLFMAMGLKVIASPWIEIGDALTLLAVIGLLALGLTASIATPKRDKPAPVSPVLRGVEEWVWISYRQARRLVVFLMGATLMLIGVIMLVTPGPALIVIPLGVAVLAIEFAWARRWLRWIRATFGEVERRVSTRIRSFSASDEDGDRSKSSDSATGEGPDSRFNERGTHAP